MGRVGAPAGPGLDGKGPKDGKGGTAMLLIADPDVKEVLRVEDIIDHMERAFAEEARGIAVNKPRTRYKVPPDRDSDGYMANIIPGAVPSSGVAALRYDSIVVRERVVEGLKRMDFPYPARRSWGFVLLFDLESAEPLAIVHDFSLSAMRVGATTGVAVRSLSREDSRVVGLFGSGNEAEQNLAAICAVRPVREVRVFSVTREHRERFAREMTGKLDVQVRAVDNAKAVVEGADIVMCATNASRPVFDGDWLAPGQFVTTIVNSDGVHRRTEADPTTFTRADLIVINNRETALHNQQREMLDLIDEGRIGWDRICELGQVLIGENPGRKSGEDIIYYKSNTGVGIQFAAAGAVIYEACKKKGLGRELPTSWFGADVGEWLDKGFMPSP